MTTPSLIEELSRVDEPQAVEQFAKVLTEVAQGHRPVIVRRNGEDLAAVVPLEYLELIRDSLARQEAEKLAAQIDWQRAPQLHRPTQAWFEDTDNPFEPEEELAP